MMKTRIWLIGVMVLVGIAVATNSLLRGARSSAGSGDNAATTSLAAVTRGSLAKQLQINGTLGYAGSYAVLGQAHGTVTWLPGVGQVISQNSVLYTVDGEPVVLLYGATPAYRALTSGVKGRDVAQLNRDLVALGYATKSDVDSDRFTWATKAGVKKLQAHLGVRQSGALALGDVVFLPTAARVTALQTTLGGPAAGPVLQASSTVPTVSVALAADLQSEVAVGDKVTITLPDGKTTTGTVASVGKVAVVSGNPGGSVTRPAVPVLIKPTDARATSGLDQAPVLVAITTATVRDALAVPVYALLAQSGGGYAVEVADAEGTRHLVTVSPGLFDDATGLVQVTGSGLAEGQHVVVPAS
jgi:hypothetical protein